jgi:uncharacterized protein DUF4326
MPEGAVYVGRPTRWGNPWHARWFTRAQLLKVYRDWMAAGAASDSMYGLPPTREEIQRELAGKDLACWCQLDQPCHADVLLELANAGSPDA